MFLKFQEVYAAYTDFECSCAYVRRITEIKRMIFMEMWEKLSKEQTSLYQHWLDLLMLSELLGVHMEEMLVKKSAEIFAYDITQEDLQATQRRLIAYYKKIYWSVA